MHEYPFSPNICTIGGHRLHYIDEGQGPVIVMLHGNPTWSYFYRHLIRLLAKTHRVIAPDHIGCGLSDKPQNYAYTLQQHINNLQTLLDTIKIDRYSLIVHDWGGAIGLGCAVAKPRRLEQLVLFNTAAFRSKRIPLRIRICRWPVLGALLVRGLNGFAGAALSMAVTKTLSMHVRKAYIHPYTSWKNRVAIHAFVQDIPLTTHHPSYQTLVHIENGLAQLQGTEIPKLILWGGKDFCFDTVFYQEWLRRFPEAQRVFFPNAGHYVLEDAREEILPLIENFFCSRE